MVSLFAFGPSPAGRSSRTQNCTLVRSVCLSALEATRTSAPDLVESDASAETATSNVTIVNGAYTVALTPLLSVYLIGPLPAGDAFACLLMLLCRENRPSIMCDEVLQVALMFHSNRLLPDGCVYRLCAWSSRRVMQA